MKKDKNLFKTHVLALRQAFLPISYKLNGLNFKVLHSHNKMLEYLNKMLEYLNKKTSTFEDISRQVQSRLDGLFARLQTINMILLLYGVALTAILITLLFI